MICLLVVLLPYLSIISSIPIPAADPFTGMEMMTTGFMMTAAGSMMAAALLAKGIHADTGLAEFSHAFIGFLLGALIPKKAKKPAPVYVYYRRGYTQHAQYGHNTHYGHSDQYAQNTQYGQ